jgi:hypothetical protein
VRAAAPRVAVVPEEAVGDLIADLHHLRGEVFVAKRLHHIASVIVDSLLELREA